MGDGAAEWREASLAELAKERTRSNLLRLALWRTRSPPMAEDLVQSALLVVFDQQAKPWNPSGGVGFLAHVGSIINGLAANARRSWTATHEVIDGALTRDENTVDEAPLADAELDARRELTRKRRLGEALLAALDADDPEAAAVLRAAMAGAEGHRAIAERAGCEPAKVRNALDRITYRAKQIDERDRRAEAERMAAVRRTSKPHLEKVR